MAVADKTIDNTVGFSHAFYQVKLLPDGDTKTHYVLDLSGAQYGWHDPVFPFDEHILKTATTNVARDSNCSTEEDSLYDDNDTGLPPVETYLVAWETSRYDYYQTSRDHILGDDDGDDP